MPPTAITDASDADLLERFRRDGDQEALERLIHRHAGWVHRVCCRVTGDASLADDATQAVFILLNRHAAGLRRAEALPAWLQATARRAALQALRGERRRKRHESDAAREETGRRERAAADEPDLVVTRGRLDGWLARLTTRQRDVVVRFYLQGQSQAAIAGELGCSVDAIKQRLAGGLKSLRRQAARCRCAVPITALLALVAPADAAATPAIITRLSADGATGLAGTGRAVRIARGVLRTMFIKSATLATAAVATIAIVISAGVLAAADPPPAEPEILWETTLAGPADDRPADLIRTADGLFVAGTTDGSVAGQPHLGGRDAVLARYDEAGNRLWTVQFGTADNELAFAVAAANDLIYVGVRRTDEGGYADLVLHAFDPDDGSEVWQRLTDLGTGREPQDLVAGSGGLYVAGRISWRKKWVSRFDLAGVRQWTRSFGSNTFGTFDTVRAAAAPDGGVYVAGLDEASSFDEYMLITRLDDDGDTAWQRQERTRHLNDIYDLVADAAGNTYCVGGGTVENAVVSLDAAGSRRWACVYASQIPGNYFSLLSHGRAVLDPDRGELHVLAGVHLSEGGYGLELDRIDAVEGRLAQMTAVPLGQDPFPFSPSGLGLVVHPGGAVTYCHRLLQPPGDDTNLHDIRLVHYHVPAPVVRTISLRAAPVADGILQAVARPGPVDAVPVGEDLVLHPLYRDVDYVIELLIAPAESG